ncbi:hypothetical protein CAOG_01471 [Capsaspora owczarzaki ATCC 30864]|uniref:Programmed cell death protein 10 dimerisation domain-containing protein n=1 Tax=Capsaspora owczarzaki (strain ATCC 30864) TaxID=595528 RepID=A0A0D2U4S0_CAPO3|nr:hypothetical protein CAOG_01471 [Capsaspora owczarzaki ATCC 30864]KJE90121.1 hypothetical protein CAOG_001471 [Capsaspora owczarzaki ATCC 30864]|eukprot:XP_004364339.1 hypothetical protein CAOG_01471 [Capsaspora owczarzaki ATCC 30864]
MATHSAFAFDTVVRSALDKVLAEDDSVAPAIETLRAAFERAEQAQMGLVHSIVESILESDLDAASLGKFREAGKVAKMTESDIQQVLALGTKLVTTLQNLRSQITEKSTFLVAIKQIAGAIKIFLDSVGKVTVTDEGLANHKRLLEDHKKIFIKTSKSFSDTLKGYFKEEFDQGAVFSSADVLIRETTQLMQTLKA